MTDTAANRDPDSCVLRACKIKEIDAYYVDATGASVTQDSSVNLIHRYCEKLPRDKYGHFFSVISLSHINTVQYLFSIYLCILYTKHV